MVRPAARSILMLGDSLTRGFDPSNNTYPPWTLYMLLAERYKAVGTAVINAAGSGYNTKMMKRLLPDIRLQCQQIGLEPGLVTLWAGANDSVLPSAIPSRSQHVPLDEYKQNISDIIRYIHKEWPKARVLIITPPPSIPEKWLEQMTLEWKLAGEEWAEPEQDRTMEHTKMYVDACVEVGIGEGVKVGDAWGLVVAAAKGTASESLLEYVPDGLHLSGKGHKLIFDEVERVIKGDFVQWDPEGLEASEVSVPSPLVLPSWVYLARTPPQNTIPLPETV